MSYQVFIYPAALSALESLPRQNRNAIRNKIDALAEDPFPDDSKALKGGVKGFYRLRVGDYRIVYSVKKKRLVVVIIKIGHRREIYQKLTRHTD